MEKVPDLVAQAEEYFNNKAKQKEGTEDLFGVKYLGKNLPDELLGCKICSFIAKSERGLRIHMKRTHKITAKAP